MKIHLYYRHKAARLQLKNGALVRNVWIYCFNSGGKVWNTYGRFHV